MQTTLWGLLCRVSLQRNIDVVHVRRNRWQWDADVTRRHVSDVNPQPDVSAHEMADRPVLAPPTVAPNLHYCLLVSGSRDERNHLLAGPLSTWATDSRMTVHGRCHGSPGQRAQSLYKWCSTFEHPHVHMSMLVWKLSAQVCSSL
jgi:hypothetical protein